MPDPYKLLFVRAIRNGIQYWPRCFPSYVSPESRQYLQSGLARIFYSPVSSNNTKKYATGHVFEEGGPEPNKRSKWKKLLTSTGIDGARWKGALSSRKNGAGSSPQGGSSPTSLRPFFSRNLHKDFRASWNGIKRKGDREIER